VTSPLDPFQGVAFAANHLIIRSPRLFPSFIEKLLTFSPFFKSNENPIQARREKINARMELLKELVPGCSKVSGTALVLDEIINHVQSLQRQVEYLSMRLAAVNPRVDFGGLDNFMTTECGRMAGLNCKNGIDLEQVTWPEMGVHGARHLMQLQQQLWHGDLAHQHQAVSQWEKRGDGNPPVFSSSSPSLFGYDLTSSGAQQPPASKLKTEL